MQVLLFEELLNPVLLDLVFPNINPRTSDTSIPRTKFNKGITSGVKQAQGMNK
jgi:hypothetical protein